MKGKKYSAADEKVLTTLLRSYRGQLKFAQLDSVLYETSIEASLPKYNPLLTRVVLFQNDAALAGT